MVDRPTAPVLVETGATGARMSLRTAAPDAASAALGLPLPTKIGAISEADGRRAIALGPDEWMLFASDPTTFDGVVIEGPHALVDIGDREVTLTVSGPAVLDALAVGCPRDLARLTPGTGTRTVLDGVSIVILRQAEDQFEIHVWRSYAGHVRHLLESAAREIALGV